MAERERETVVVTEGGGGGGGAGAIVAIVALLVIAVVGYLLYSNGVFSGGTTVEVPSKIDVNVNPGGTGK